jgi:A/G-specific adenine glycosylase
MTLSLPDARWRRAFRQRLLSWYAKHARDLPWRRTNDPYAIWISEIMLQQTQVATVISYFERFMKRFPTLKALAKADERAVLRLWEGLGYYRRARQLHQAARVIVSKHGGRFPRDAEALRRLPGIGRYTAGAILSIAFDLPEPILEANTMRLWTRLLAYRGDPAAAAAQRLFWSMAQAILPRRPAGRVNQALMELGSQACLVRAPRCDSCPVSPLCRANAQGLQNKLPLPRLKQRTNELHEAAVLVRRRSRVLLVKCPEGGRWAGLWDFPRFEIHSKEPAAVLVELVENVRRLTGVDIQPGEKLKTIRHGVTRFRITLDCYDAKCLSCKSGRINNSQMRWLLLSELEQYPLSSTGRTLAKLLSSDSLNLH